MKHILLLTTVFWWMGQTTVWAQNDTTIAEGAAAETQLGAASMETKETAKKRRVELGMNVTTVLSSFVGSTSFDVVPGNFPLVLKIVSKNRQSAFRLGLGLSFDLAQTNDLNISTNTATGSEVHLKTGYEWRQHFHKRWTTYFGADLLVAYELAQNKTRLFNELITLSQADYTFGGGPVYGVQFEVNQRLMLGFEGSLYVTTTYSVEKEVFTNGGLFDREDTSWHQNGSMTVPKWLYLIVRF